MNERKILFFIFFLIIYCLYNVNMWFMTSNIPVEEDKHAEVDNQPKIKESIPIKVLPKRNPIPLFIVDACSVLDIFTKAPFVYKRKKVTNRKKRAMDSDTNNSISTIGVTIFLVLLVINAAFDVLKEKEKRKKKISTEGRRQSLAEFANKKPLRRESSKFGFQLFQIAETDKSESDEKASRRRPYTRGESINSYLSDKKPQTETAPPSIGDPNSERKLVKRQSIAKLFGARPVPMVRRSSFPVLPLNPEIQSLMMNNRQSSFDSDDEGDGKCRRVRIIRRF